MPKLPRTDDTLLRDCCQTRACLKAWATGAPACAPHTVERNPESATGGVICRYHCDRCGNQWSCRFGGYFISPTLRRVLAEADGMLVVEAHVAQKERLSLVK